MVDTTDSNIDTIGRLNDRCRQGLDRAAKVMMTSSCLAAFTEDGTSALAVQIGIVDALRRCTFDPRDRERNRGEFEFRGQTVYFSIDYYDLAREYGSEDPADPAKTRRVLMMMLRGDL